MQGLHMNWIRDVLSPGWVGSVIGLVGMVIALILYKASLVGARPVYQRRALRLIGPDRQDTSRSGGNPLQRTTC